LKQGRKWGGAVRGATVVSVVNPEFKKFEGCTVGEIAQQRGQIPTTRFFDLAVADNLQVKFVVPRANTDSGAARRHGAGLAHACRPVRRRGAPGHAVRIRYPTYLLGYWVREKRALTLERAVQRITSSRRISSASGTAGG